MGSILEEYKKQLNDETLTEEEDGCLYGQNWWSGKH